MMDRTTLILLLIVSVLNFAIAVWHQFISRRILSYLREYERLLSQPLTSER